MGYFNEENWASFWNENEKKKKEKKRESDQAPLNGICQYNIQSC